MKLTPFAISKAAARSFYVKNYFLKNDNTGFSFMSNDCWNEINTTLLLKFGPTSVNSINHGGLCLPLDKEKKKLAWQSLIETSFQNMAWLNEHF